MVARTALEDLSGIAPELVNDDRLYRGLDQLGKHKDRLCVRFFYQLGTCYRPSCLDFF